MYEGFTRGRKYEGEGQRKDEGREIGAVGRRNLIKNIKFLRM
jgi:hypothetical protein